MFTVVVVLMFESGGGVGLAGRQDGSWTLATAASLGIELLRGGEIIEVLDESQAVIGEKDETGNTHQAIGNLRTYRIAVDAAQYQVCMCVCALCRVCRDGSGRCMCLWLIDTVWPSSHLRLCFDTPCVVFCSCVYLHAQLDQEAMLASESGVDVYTTCNLLMRRQAKENNFKAVLETIRDLMNTDFSVPEWLHDVLLGYGDPKAASYYNLPPAMQLPTVDFADTFLDLEHVKHSFPGYALDVVSAPSSSSSTASASASSPTQPFYYRVSFPAKIKPDYDSLAAAGLTQAASVLEAGADSALATTTTTTTTTAAAAAAVAAAAASDVMDEAGSNDQEAEVEMAEAAPVANADSTAVDVVVPAPDSRPLAEVVKELKKLKVPELKAQLAEKSLDSNGVKDVLVDRLAAFLTTPTTKPAPAPAPAAAAAAAKPAAQTAAAKKSPAPPKATAPTAAAAAASSPVPVAVPKASGPAPVLRVEAYPAPPPAVGSSPKRNTVRYTPMQVEAIRSGTNPGLTMVVGPPGTGKTDVAVQIIVNLFRQCPTQRTLLVTHSNQALNDLFEKIMARDIDERYLLRLGHGEKDLGGGNQGDFSKFGRVNYMLQRRLDCLQHVSALAVSLGLSDEVANTCETAAHFRVYAVASRWEQFLMQCEAAASTAPVPGPSIVAQRFPFSGFFPGLVFPGPDVATDMDLARQCMARIDAVFKELEECRPFELLRSFKDRGNLLLTQHAKIIAMTCTHAALKRHDLVALGFQYDNIIMEEAAQILEIETFIPMLLQTQDKESGHRLKRVVLIGDHHQLPPVVKNRAFQKYSHLDQSMFTRMVRLGTPTITLNVQGRARPGLSALYRWRYKQLGDLPSVHLETRFTRANTGFAHPLQFIDVGDFNGRGESTPTAHFYQNLGEAEYIVQTFMLMRLLGYPADKISIITSYNGQKFLIRDVLQRRCAHNPLFGEPARVTTVDKFQGQQNDCTCVHLDLCFVCSLVGWFLLLYAGSFLCICPWLRLLS
jgi:hypothetical protein